MRSHRGFILLVIGVALFYGVVMVRAGIGQPLVEHDEREVPSAVALPVSGSQDSDCTMCHTGSAFEGMAVFHPGSRIVRTGSEMPR
jgi:hypothetical protein